MYLCVAAECYLCIAMPKKYLYISTAYELFRIDPEMIVFISSDGNYCNIAQADNEMRMVTYQLGTVEEFIRQQLGKESRVFLRVGKRHIINRNYIYYINTQTQKLILSDMERFSYTVSPSKDALKQLRELIEKEEVPCK